MSNNKDPLELGDIEPANIAKDVEAKSKGKLKQPSEYDIQKEERLSKREARLAGGGKGSASAPPAPPPPQADFEAVDPSALLDRINAYKERFPKLKSRNKISAKSSIEEIEDELHFLELQLGGSKDGSMGTMIFLGTMTGLETVTTEYWNPLNLQLQGLGKVAKDNISEFQDVIDELMIKYGAGFYMSPEYRLVIAVGALVFTVHSANNGDARVGEALKKMNTVAKPPVGAESM